MSLRELMIEYILFAFDPSELAQRFCVTEDELADLTDMDLLEIYDHTLLAPAQS